VLFYISFCYFDKPCFLVKPQLTYNFKLLCSKSVQFDVTYASLMS